MQVTITHLLNIWKYWYVFRWHDNWVKTNLKFSRTTWEDQKNIKKAFQAPRFSKVNYTMPHKGDKQLSIPGIPTLVKERKKHLSNPKHLLALRKLLLTMYKSAYVLVSPLLYLWLPAVLVCPFIWIVDCAYRSGHVYFEQSNCMKTKILLYIPSLHTCCLLAIWM